jgi:hypothetical protein
LPASESASVEQAFDASEPTKLKDVSVISSTKASLENGEPKPGWKPRTDTIADTWPGSRLKCSYEERQRKPDENLAHSDTGIVMQRWLLREQLQHTIEQGLDPI